MSAGTGYDAEAAQVHRAADRVEHQRTDRLVVEHGQQPAVLLQQPRERLGGLGQRGGGRVERRAHLEGGADHRQHLDGRLRPDASYVDAHRLSTRSAAAAISWSRAALTRSCRSRITMWPAPSHSTRSESGMLRVQLAAVPDRGELVLGAADDRGRHRLQRLDRVELVERAEVREELRDHLERRRRQHLVDELDVALPARRRRRRTGRSPPIATYLPTRRRPSTCRWPRARVATSRVASWPPMPSGSSGRRIRCGSSPPAVVEIRPTPTTRSPNSSGCCSASAMIDMPPIEWPTRTTGPSGTTSSMTAAGRGRAGRWSRARGRAAGPAVRALVVEHGAHQAAVAGPLEVPAVQVERVAVHEDDGERGSAAARCGGGRVAACWANSSTSTCSGTPSSATTVIGVGAQRPERRRRRPRRGGR